DQEGCGATLSGNGGNHIALCSKAEHGAAKLNGHGSTKTPKSTQFVQKFLGVESLLINAFGQRRQIRFDQRLHAIKQASMPSVIAHDVFPCRSVIPDKQTGLSEGQTKAVSSGLV